MRALRIAILCSVLVATMGSVAFGDEARMHGTVQSIGPGRTLLLRADDGRSVVVDFSRDDIDPRLLTVGEKITVAGVIGGHPPVLRATTLVQDEERQMQRVHGAVVSVGPGRRLVLRADDGRMLNVDFSRDEVDARQLTPGEKVTVVGVTGRELNVFTAYNVIQDEERQAQRVHGTVVSVGPGRRLGLRTDDGRVLDVDISRDDTDLRQLTLGEKVTVVGVTGRELNVFRAHDVIQDEGHRIHRVRGTVLSVGPGRVLVLRTDDGRTLDVDFSRDTNIDVRRLTRGERVTVVGAIGRDATVFSASRVVLESPAALPR